MSEIPPALSWVTLFAASANRALDGDIVEVTMTPTADPLQWAMLVRLPYPWKGSVSAFLRTVLDSWCTANDAVYTRAGIGKNNTCWHALIVLKSLGPEKKVDPYDEDSVENRRARRRLRCATRE